MISKFFQHILFIFLIDCSFAQQQPNAGDQIATGLASALLNAIFPQLNNRNDNFNVRPQPSFSNIPVLTAPRTDFAPSQPVFGLTDGRVPAPSDLQSFQSGAPFLSGLGNGNGLSQALPVFPPLQQLQQQSAFLQPPGFGSNFQRGGNC